MITWKFEIEKQQEYYQTVKKQLEREIYQELKYYVLPFMPEKFRGRVIFLPKICSPELIYKKQKFRLNKLESEWNNIQEKFKRKIIKYFPELNSIDVVISPSFYGSVGWYGFWDNGKTILICARYDRKLIDIQKLVINALSHYFFISKKSNLNKDRWLLKQKKAKEIQSKIFLKNVDSTKSKNMHTILDTEFSGKLAEESIRYLKELGLIKESRIEILIKLTKTQKAIFDLLTSRKEKLVSFDEIAKAIWGENYFDKYSEYAITKHIEELKKKITKNSIHSKRSYGYILT